MHFFFATIMQNNIGVDTASNAVAMEEKVLQLPENIIKLADIPFDQSDPSKLN